MVPRMTDVLSMLDEADWPIGNADTLVSLRPDSARLL